MPKRWQINSCSPESVALLENQGLHPVVARIMAGRGFCEPEQARQFLAPSLAGLQDPFGMVDMDKAVSRLVLALNEGQQVCIYGDYDVDGITATVLLVSVLSEMGFRVCYHIPNRLDDGYGLNSEALQTIHDGGSRLVVTVDCGVTAVNEAKYCRNIGLDLIITDHHQPQDALPDAVAVINPNRPDCPYSFKGLAGVGVAFQLLVALRARLRVNGNNGNGPDLRQWLDLVALGSIADLVPLSDQNRILVYAGLQRMSNGCRLGLAALKQVSGVKGAVSAGQVGFRLAPRLNAAGRLESAVPGVELLLGDDPAKAVRLAEELDAANSERQQLEARIFQEAVAMLEQSGGVAERFSIVLSSEKWHPGVVGIVASRIVERYHRPTILIAVGEDGVGKGSGRSIPGFHLLDALKAASAGLERFGGHRAAAGVTVNAAKIQAFTEAFEAVASSRLAPDDLMPLLNIDCEADAGQIAISLARQLEQLAPFGMGNPEPVLCMRNLKLIESKKIGGSHLKLRLSKDHHQFNAIAWRMADVYLPQQLDLAFCCEIDTWGGGERLQLRVKDIRPSEGHDAA